MRCRKFCLLAVAVALAPTPSACAQPESRSYGGYTAAALLQDDVATAQLVMTNGINASYSFDVSVFNRQAGSITVQANHFSGVYSYVDINAPEATTVHFQLNMDVRNMRLVAVDELMNLTQIAGEGETSKAVALPVQAGKTRIAIAGDAGKGSMVLTGLRVESAAASIDAPDVARISG